MPGGCQRAGLGFTVTDNARDEQAGVVKDRAEGMAERISKLAPFVDRAWRFGRDVAWDAAGKGELLEELFEAGRVLRDSRINFTVRSFEIHIRDDGRPAMAGTGNVNHVEAVLL